MSPVRPHQQSFSGRFGRFAIKSITVALPSSCLQLSRNLCEWLWHHFHFEQKLMMLERNNEIQQHNRIRLSAVPSGINALIPPACLHVWIMVEPAGDTEKQKCRETQGGGGQPSLGHRGGVENRFIIFDSINRLDSSAVLLRRWLISGPVTWA